MEMQKIWKWFYSTLLVLLMPNCIFWMLAPKVSMVRGVFVFEYLLIACLYPFINRRFFITIWILFAIYDLVFATTTLFFMDFFEIAHALAKIPNMSFIDMLKWAGVLLLFTGAIFGLVKLLIRYNTSYRILHFRFLWPLIIFCLAINIINGGGSFKKWAIPLYHSKKDIVSAPSWPFIKAVQHAIVRSTAKHNVEYLGSAAQKVFNQPPAGEAAKKEALILVESWGLLNNKELQHEVLQPIYDLAKGHLYTIKEDSTPYKYLTQAGEFRELTGYVFHYYQVKDKWVKENSLLIKKQQQGYHVIGVHGNTGRFYRRQIIWPVLGVQEMFFSEDFTKLSMPSCGNSVFRGICDTAINTWLLDNMNRQPDRKEFYYWVTLNTHFPLVEIHDEAYRVFSEKWKTQGITENLLQLAYQHRLFFKDIANKLSKPGAPKGHVLLVGDHAPPLMDPTDRKLFSTHWVPYIELTANL
ncbi:hypothetical protein FAM09_07890 [Niastella caeni]|uniref:Sulfatase N-terminal domain-containing protein n=1 Tax=Niastella caeni TaxID=2569763 RepID=A0A4S8HYB8_9BACT|nr:sulfatase-like hydrolase/transferase [Niastella caeni]THU39809.1 hypothetical protein FAM09_07890 [Niastella caeni]